MTFKCVSENIRFANGGSRSLIQLTCKLMKRQNTTDSRFLAIISRAAFPFALSFRIIIAATVMIVMRCLIDNIYTTLQYFCS